MKESEAREFLGSTKVARRGWVIQNVYGSYWDGDNWGTRSNAEVYDSARDLPMFIESSDGEELELEVYSDDDARYFIGDDPDSYASITKAR